MKKILLTALIASMLLLRPFLSFGQAPNLGSTSSFALFTAVGAFNNSGLTTITGDIGTNVGAFNIMGVTLIGQSHVADPASATAATDVDLAYGMLSTVTCGSVIATTMGGGQSLLPNVYCLGAASTINGDLILDGGGNPNSIFIFKIDGALATSVNSRILLTNGASLCNVYWQVNGEVDLGGGSLFQGTILANGAINILAGAKLNGRGLTRAGAISLFNNTIVGALPVASVITAGGTTTFCAGNNVVLSGNVGGTWSNGDITPTTTVSTSGDYFVTNTAACGTVKSNHIIVTVTPLPTASVITAGSATTFCAGGNVKLSGNMGGTWSNMATTPDITVSTTGDYFVTNSNVCGSVTSNHIMVNADGMQPTASTIIADGALAFCANGSVGLSGNVGGTWSTGATSPGITVFTSGDYFVTNSASCGSVTSNHFLVTVFPTAPTITAPSNTCASAFTLPNVPPVAGFTVEYSIDLGAYAAAPSIPTTSGCHTISARYVLTATFGTTLAGTAGSGVCGVSNTVSVVIFPNAPSLSAPVNTCASAFILPSVSAVTGFSVQYNIDGGGYTQSPVVPTTPGCHTISARYVLTATCGGTIAGTPGSGLCGASNMVSVVVFPNAPSLSAPANTCALAFTLPSVSTVSGFSVEYSIDGGVYAASPALPTTPGCHTIAARYVLAVTCGGTVAGTAGSGLCGSSNTVNVVIFPNAPSLTAPANTCASAFTLPSVSAVSGFSVEYSIDGGGYAQSPAVPTTPGCHMITARYVLTAICGGTAAGTAGTGLCGVSNTVSVVILPNTPTLSAPANTCALAFTLPSVSTVSGFSVEYSIDGGVYAASPILPTTPGCHTIAARYVLTATCGGTAGSGLCGASNTVSVVIFPNAPSLTAPANTCATAFTLPSVSTVSGFSVEYNIDGGGYAKSPSVPTTPGCHTITARYVLTATCGGTSAGTAGTGLCGVSNTVNVVILPNTPILSAPANTCALAFTLPSVSTVSGFSVEYSIDGGVYAASPILPTTPGCHTIAARYVLTATCGGTAGSGLCGASNTVNVVIFPNAPNLSAPVNTCASAFTLPSVSAVSGFNIEYSLDGGGYAQSPTVPTTPGCHTISARYVLIATCGGTLAGTAGSGLCGASNMVNVVIFPNAPSLSASNTCASAFTLPSVSAVSGFNIEYSLDGGGYAQSPTVPTTPGCHTISARYVLIATCGGTMAGSMGTGLCGVSNTVSVVIFPNAPNLSAPANTCASAFTLPSVSTVIGFTIEYNIDGSGYVQSPTVPTTPGCHTITARYVLTAICGGTVAGTAGTGLCAVSNTVNVVIFPNAPSLTAPANTCAPAFTLPSVSAVSGFTIEYSLDGGGYAKSPIVPTTPGCHTISARYVLTATCGGTVAGTTGSGLCGVSNTVSVVIFPNAPSLSAPANTCASAFTLPSVNAVSGFNVEFSIDGGVYTTSPTIPTTPGCHTISARYVLMAICGLTTAGSVGAGLCSASNMVSVVIFPATPTLIISNTCETALTFSNIASVSGFKSVYDVTKPNGTLVANDVDYATAIAALDKTIGIWTITAGYALTSTCGSTAAGTESTDASCKRVVVNTAQVFQAVTVNAGVDQIVSTCIENGKTILAGIILGGITTGTWIGGLGTFTPDRTTLNATYTPTAAEIAAGSVTLTLQSDDPAGPCPAVSDQVVIRYFNKVTIECLVCINQVNVTLDANCTFALTPKSVLEGFATCPNRDLLEAALEVIIGDGNTNNLIECAGTYKYVIQLKKGFEACFDYAPCWGTVTAEDKTAPLLTNPNGISTPLLCTDINFVLNNAKTIGATGTVDGDGVKNIGEYIFTDNCKNLRLCNHKKME